MNTERTPNVRREQHSFVTNPNIQTQNAIRRADQRQIGLQTAPALVFEIQSCLNK